MSLRISAVMMSMPLDSCVTMQVWWEAGVGMTRGPRPFRTRGSPKGLGLPPAQPAPSSPRSVQPHAAPMAHLVLVAGTLTVLGEGLQGLDDEAHVVLIDVEPQQPQAAGSAAAHDVQELQRLHLLDCMECGSCAYKCPGKLPLVEQFRKGKGMLRAAIAEQKAKEEKK